ncbi:Argonaute siRNA chaperone complex subunit Arb1-domain-containing protein [Pilobolus umbonatus]|nr:Argonaute siRNA chaperone complex subunit Arb1-domain-containing protein [Pilobolus umbonatus]
MSAEKKKKKNKKKKKSAKLPEAGTELHDDYAEKYAEDVIDNPFDPSRPLAHRVEYAIWKYRKNHKFPDHKKRIFDDYLKFGGIVTGPNMFLGRGTSADDTGDGEVDYEAAKLAIDSVPEMEEGMEVSFSEVAQVYFSNTFIRETKFIALQDFIDAPIVIDAFLRYLEIRNVAPEYKEDLAKAREIIAEAKIQLPKCKMISGDLPGKFNTACHILFGEAEVEMDMSWMNEASMMIRNTFDSFVEVTVGMSKEEARSLVKEKMKEIDGIHVIEKNEQALLKVHEISPYTDADVFIQVVLKNYHDNQGYYSIYLEKEIVENMLVGMVMTATLCKLSNGQHYLEFASRIMPNFYMEDECLGEESFDF